MYRHHNITEMDEFESTHLQVCDLEMCKFLSEQQQKKIRQIEILLSDRKYFFIQTIYNNMHYVDSAAPLPSLFGGGIQDVALLLVGQHVHLV